MKEVEEGYQKFYSWRVELEQPLELLELLFDLRLYFLKTLANQILLWDLMGELYLPRVVETCTSLQDIYTNFHLLLESTQQWEVLFFLYFFHQVRLHTIFLPKGSVP